MSDAEVTITRHVDGLTIVATLTPNEEGRLAIRELRLTTEHFNVDTFRKVKIGAIEAEANGRNAESGDLDAFTGRCKGERPAAFAERFGRAYLAACAVTHRPAAEIAERCDVPVTTVRAWIREARLRGVLAPGKRGRAG